MLAVALFAGLELLINNVLEPWLYGSSTGLSPIAILVAAVFWTTLWGPAGLLLATPLTVCLVVLGRHLPQLGFLEVLLGSEPVLAPEVRLYQRLLAGDLEEVSRVTDEYLEEHTVQECYDKVLIPALAFADQDRMRGALNRERWTADYKLSPTLSTTYAPKRKLGRRLGWRVDTDRSRASGGSASDRAVRRLSE